MARACYHCGKQIRGKAKIVVPPLLLVRLIGEFTKAYHPSCYDKSEVEASSVVLQQEGQKAERTTKGTCMTVTKAVEDLSRVYGRPTLGRVVWFVNDDKGRAISMHLSEEEARASLKRHEEDAKHESLWGKLSHEQRHALRREYNRLPGVLDTYRSVAHYAFERKENA